MSALAEALIAAQAELPTALGRDAANETAGYRYMTLDALIAATRPILNKHNLSISQWPSFELVYGGGEHPATLRPMLTTRIEHASSVSTGYSVDAYEYKMPLYLADKSMQALGSAITYARRYAWASALGIAAEEDTDAAPMPQEDIPF